MTPVASTSMTKNCLGMVASRESGRFEIAVTRRPEFINTVELRVIDGQQKLSSCRMLDDFDLQAHPMDFYIREAINDLKMRAPVMTATEVLKCQNGRYGELPKGLTVAKLHEVVKNFMADEKASDPSDKFVNSCSRLFGGSLDAEIRRVYTDAMIDAAKKVPSRLRGLVPPTPATVPDVEPELVADGGPEGDEFMGDVSRVLTPEFRASFPKLFKAEAFQEGQDPKYSMVMLFPKKMSAEMQKRFDAMKAMTSAAAKAKWGDKIPKNLRSPFRDGSEKDLPGYEDCIFVSASSKIKPGLVNEEAEPILSPEDFYPGCYAHAYVTCYAYDMAGNRGVAFGLSTVQKTRDGDAFAPRNNAQDDFAPVTPGSDVSASAPEDIFKV